MKVHELSRVDARRIAVRAQLLGRDRPTGILDVVRHLTMLQIDPIAAVAPSADLVLWSRLGSRYSPAELNRALADRTLVEMRAMIRPSEDVVLYRAEMAEWRGPTDMGGWRESYRLWVRTNDACRRDILDRLGSFGPLTSRDLPDTCKIPWQSTGWRSERNVIQMLELMEIRGEVAVAGRKGRERLWDLASRVFPDDPVIPSGQAVRRREGRRLRALGIARATGPACPVEPLDVGDVGEPAVVEGIRGEWRVDPSLLVQPFTGRAALLSPFDRLVHDRKRALALFGFEYQLEIYKPAGKRRWGYYALPILYGDRLIGKLDATTDRDAGVLRVGAIHEDVTFNKAMAVAVEREIKDLARWLALDLALPRQTPERPTPARQPVPQRR